VQYLCDVDVGARDRERARQEYGAVPIPAGEGRVRAILQTAPCQETSTQQECLRWLGKEYDLQVKGLICCPAMQLYEMVVIWNLVQLHLR